MKISNEESARDSRHPDSRKRKVAKRACLACRERKIKCDGEANPDPSGGPGKCTNCVRSTLECVFVASNRGGRRVFDKSKRYISPPSSDVCPVLAESAVKSQKVDICDPPNPLCSSNSSVLGSSHNLPVRPYLRAITSSAKFPTRLSGTPASIHDSIPNNNNGLMTHPLSNHSKPQQRSKTQHQHQSSYPNSPHNFVLPQLTLENHHQLLVESRPLTAGTSGAHTDNVGKHRIVSNSLRGITHNSHFMVNVGQNPVMHISQFMSEINNSGACNKIYPGTTGLSQNQEKWQTQPSYSLYSPVNSLISFQHSGNMNIMGHGGVDQPQARPSINYGNDFNTIPAAINNTDVPVGSNSNLSGNRTEALGHYGHVLSTISQDPKSNWQNRSSRGTKDCLNNLKSSQTTPSSSSKPNTQFDVKKEFTPMELNASKRLQSDINQGTYKLPKYGSVPAFVFPTLMFGQEHTNENSAATPAATFEKAFPVLNQSQPQIQEFVPEQIFVDLHRCEIEQLAQLKLGSIGKMPSFHLTMELLDLYYEYVHPKVKVLPPKEVMKRISLSQTNTSLTYAIFLCAIPLTSLKNKTKLSESGFLPTMSDCLREISTHWEELDFIGTLQTLNILVYHSIFIQMNSRLTAMHLEKLLKTIAYSNIVGQYRNGPNLEEFFTFSTNTSFAHNRTLLMNLWIAFSQVCCARNIFRDHSLLHEVLSSLCSTQERLEDVILPHDQLVFITYTKNIPQNFSGRISIKECPEKNKKSLDLFHLRDLEKKHRVDIASSVIYQFYIWNIFHDWKNQKIDNITALAKLNVFDLSIQNRLYELKDEKRLLVVDWDVLNCLALSQTLKINLRENINKLDILICDVFDSELRLVDVAELSEAVDSEISSFEAFSIMLCFQSMFRLLDVITLIELASGNIPAHSSSLNKTPIVSFRSCNDYIEQKSAEDYSRIHPAVQSEDNPEELEESYGKVQENDSFLNDTKKCVWMRYPPIFINLLRFALPKIVQDIIWFKFIKFVTFDGKCALIYANKSIPLDESQFNAKSLISYARGSLYFGNSNLSDEELLAKLVLVAEPTFLKQKFILLSEFTKVVSASLSDRDLVHQKVDQLTQYVNVIIGLTF